MDRRNKIIFEVDGGYYTEEQRKKDTKNQRLM